MSTTLFDILKDECKNIQFDFEINKNKVQIENLLEKVYILDENDIPSVYKLIEISTLIPQFEKKV
jgi:hypothetical protein